MRRAAASLVASLLAGSFAACASSEASGPLDSNDSEAVEAVDAAVLDIGELDAGSDVPVEADSRVPLDPCGPRDPQATAGGPDWTRDACLRPGESRGDIYGVGALLGELTSAGFAHSLTWPVSVSGVLLPWRPIYALFDPAATDQATLDLQGLARTALGFGTVEEMYDWLGLARYDGDPDSALPASWPAGVGEGDPLGASRLQLGPVEVLSFSCATCHTAQVFGRTVVGLTNRQARANEFFHLAAGFFPNLPVDFFQSVTGANPDELAEFVRAQKSLAAIGNRVPQAQGLDTSLAQVALSLARREDDAWATRNPDLEVAPRPNALDTDVVDSKPAVWWTLKYKTRWLLDGSIVSGNPVFTNFLWNEIGRGTDLHQLKDWLEQNQDAVKALTAAAFATEPLRWNDLAGESRPIDLAAAKRGETHFLAMCSSCHGTYSKAWASDGPLASADPTATVAVAYHSRTPVLDVGSDPARAKGMAAFADNLNNLAISQWMGTVVEVQTGYVPPPLDGIWIRYPYLHNQSVPTLCELLRPASKRSAEFWVGPDRDLATDFDADCVGLPVGDAVPAAWKDEPRRRMDTSRTGLSNQGHDRWLVRDDGSEILSAPERADLVEFLKTL